MGYDTNNIFAKILRGEIPSTVMAENKHAISIANAFPKADIHDLVLPKGPYADFSGFVNSSTEDEFNDFFGLIHETARVRNLLSARSQFLINNGSNGGQTVPHLHGHVFNGAPLIQAVPMVDGADILVSSDEQIPVVSGELNKKLGLEYIRPEAYSLHNVLTPRGCSSFWAMSQFVEQRGFRSALQESLSAYGSDYQLSVDCDPSEEVMRVHLSKSKQIHLRESLQAA